MSYLLSKKIAAAPFLTFPTFSLFHHSPLSSPLCFLRYLLFNFLFLICEILRNLRIIFSSLFCVSHNSLCSFPSPGVTFGIGMVRIIQA